MVSVGRQAALRIIPLTVFCFVSCSGCNGRGVTLATGSGSVSVDGEPISGVVISLEPLAPTTGPKATTGVFNGKFSFGPEAKLHGGRYRVRFTAMPTSLLSQLTPSDYLGLIDEGQNIPDEFDFRSKLEWVLAPGEQNQNTFEIDVD